MSTYFNPSQNLFMTDDEIKTSLSREIGIGATMELESRSNTPEEKSKYNDALFNSADGTFNSDSWWDAAGDDLYINDDQIQEEKKTFFEMIKSGVSSVPEQASALYDSASENVSVAGGEVIDQTVTETVLDAAKGAALGVSQFSTDVGGGALIVGTKVAEMPQYISDFMGSAYDWTAQRMGSESRAVKTTIRPDLSTFRDDVQDARDFYKETFKREKGVQSIFGFVGQAGLMSPLLAATPQVAARAMFGRSLEKLTMSQAVIATTVGESTVSAGMNALSQYASRNPSMQEFVNGFIFDSFTFGLSGAVLNAPSLTKSAMNSIKEKTSNYANNLKNTPVEKIDNSEPLELIVELGMDKELPGVVNKAMASMSESDRAMVNAGLKKLLKIQKAAEETPRGTPKIIDAESKKKATLNKKVTKSDERAINIFKTIGKKYDIINKSRNIVDNIGVAKIRSFSKSADGAKDYDSFLENVYGTSYSHRHTAMKYSDMGEFIAKESKNIGISEKGMKDLWKKANKNKYSKAELSGMYKLLKEVSPDDIPSAMAPKYRDMKGQHKYFQDQVDQYIENLGVTYSDMTKSERKRIRNMLTLSEADIRRRVYAGGDIDYSKVDAILEGAAYRINKDRLQGLQSDIIKNAGDKIDPDYREVAMGIIPKNITKENYSSDQLLNIYNQAKEFTNAGRDKYKNYQAEKQSEVDALLVRVENESYKGDEIVGGKQMGVKAGQTAPKKGTGAINKIRQAFGNLIISADTVFELMDDTNDMKGPNFTMYMDALDAESKADVRHHDTVQRIQSSLEKLDETALSDINYFIPFLREIYKDDKDYNNVVNSLIRERDGGDQPITREEIDKITSETTLSAEELDLIGLIKDEVASRYDGVNNANKVLHGESVGYIDGYFPMIAKSRIDENGVEVSFSEADADANFAMSEFGKSMKAEEGSKAKLSATEKKESSSGVLYETDVLKILDKYVRAADRFVEMGPVLERNINVVRSPKYEQSVGSNNANYARSLFLDMKNPSRLMGAEKFAATSERVNTNIANTYMAFSPSLSVASISSYPELGGIVGFDKMAIGAKDTRFGTDGYTGAQVSDFITNASDHMKIHSQATTNYLNDSLSDSRYGIHEILDDKDRKATMQIGYAMQHHIQYDAAKAAWIGVYKSALKDSGKGFDISKVDPDAKRQADSKLVQAISVPGLSAKPRLMRDGTFTINGVEYSERNPDTAAFARMATKLLGYVMKSNSNMYRSMTQARRGKMSENINSRVAVADALRQAMGIVSGNILFHGTKSLMGATAGLAFSGHFYDMNEDRGGGFAQRLAIDSSTALVPGGAVLSPGVFAYNVLLRDVPKAGEKMEQFKEDPTLNNAAFAAFSILRAGTQVMGMTGVDATLEVMQKTHKGLFDNGSMKIDVKRNIQHIYENEGKDAAMSFYKNYAKYVNLSDFQDAGRKAMMEKYDFKSLAFNKGNLDNAEKLAGIGSKNEAAFEEVFNAMSDSQKEGYMQWEVASAFAGVDKIDKFKVSDIYKSKGYGPLAISDTDLYNINVKKLIVENKDNKSFNPNMIPHKSSWNAFRPLVAIDNDRIEALISEPAFKTLLSSGGSSKMLAQHAIDNGWLQRLNDEGDMDALYSLFDKNFKKELDK